MHRLVKSPKRDRGRFLVSGNCSTFVASRTTFYAVLSALSVMFVTL